MPIPISIYCRYKEQEEAARLKVLDEKDSSPNHAEDSESTCSAERLVIEDGAVEVEPVEVLVPGQAEGLQSENVSQA